MHQPEPPHIRRCTCSREWPLPSGRTPGIREKPGLVSNGDLTIKYGPKLEISHDLTINDEQWGFKQL